MYYHLKINTKKALKASGTPVLKYKYCLKWQPKALLSMSYCVTPLCMTLFSFLEYHMRTQWPKLFFFSTDAVPLKELREREWENKLCTVDTLPWYLSLVMIKSSFPFFFPNSVETGQEEMVRAFNVRAGFAVDAKAPFVFFFCAWVFVPVFVPFLCVCACTCARMNVPRVLCVI